MELSYDHFGIQRNWGHLESSSVPIPSHNRNRCILILLLSGIKILLSLPFYHKFCISFFSIVICFL